MYSTATLLLGRRGGDALPESLDTRGYTCQAIDAVDQAMILDCLTAALEHLRNWNSREVTSLLPSRHAIKDSVRS